MNNRMNVHTDVQQQSHNLKHCVTSKEAYLVSCISQTHCRLSQSHKLKTCQKLGYMQPSVWTSTMKRLSLGMSNPWFLPLRLGILHIHVRYNILCFTFYSGWEGMYSLCTVQGEWCQQELRHDWDLETHSKSDHVKTFQANQKGNVTAVIKTFVNV